MIESRRGFLQGAAKLIGAGLTLALVPEVVARAAEPLIWTPEPGQPIPFDRTGRRVAARVESVPFQSPLAVYLTVHRQPIHDQETLRQVVVSWALNPESGGLQWSVPEPDGIVCGTNRKLCRVGIWAETVSR